MRHKVAALEFGRLTYIGAGASSIGLCYASRRFFAISQITAYFTQIIIHFADKNINLIFLKVSWLSVTSKLKSFFSHM